MRSGSPLACRRWCPASPALAPGLLRATQHLASSPQLLQVLAQAARQQQEQQAKQQPPQAPAASPAVPPAQTQTMLRTQEPDPVLLYKLERVERQVGPSTAVEALRCMLQQHMPCHVRRSASCTRACRRGPACQVTLERSCLQAHDLREEREGLMRDVAKLRTALQEVSAAGKGAALGCMLPLAVVG